MMTSYEQIIRVRNDLAGKIRTLNAFDLRRGAALTTILNNAWRRKNIAARLARRRFLTTKKANRLGSFTLYARRRGIHL